MPRTPLLLLSDGPGQPSGLGRIASDLAAQIRTSDLPVDLVHVGGEGLPLWSAWRHVPLPEAVRADDWGARYVAQVWRQLWGDQPGILWGIWDPSRLYAYLDVDLPVQRWGYLPIDGVNRTGGIGGPARETVARLDRVLAYGRWGMEVLRQIRPEVLSLPHGIVPALWKGDDVDADADDDVDAWVRRMIGPYRKQADRLVGCVATNQPRKDLALYVDTIAELRARGHHVYGWLLTDTLVKAWSLQELIGNAGLSRAITVSTDVYQDDELARLYRASTVTIAPGRGEGFGYPIVESLAAGTPVVHVEDAGGAELIPKREWRFPVRERQPEGVYALWRPVARAEDVANAIERVWDWQATIGEADARAYCRGAVAHLDWAHLWPRWRQWIAAGL